MGEPRVVYIRAPTKPGLREKIVASGRGQGLYAAAVHAFARRRHRRPYARDPVALAAALRTAAPDLIASSLRAKRSLAFRLQAEARLWDPKADAPI